ncbi:hypothetical protein [Profundibacter amoris]|uniref:Lipoprotein n=1 Tax=Profundibacter amoris TaxID=2171755 RepID=A0A347UK97_9RHOB|nr:hypothetical protein [Profundibacter amoris]AXX99275.1 hypothetical protein BAR1_15845 [Profundibacter amoris]
MLTTAVRQIAILGFVGLLASGCIQGQNDPETRPNEDNAKNTANVSLVLEKAIIQDTGALELSIAFVNKSNRNVCIAQRAKDNSYQLFVDIIAPAKGLRMFSQDDNPGISEVPDYTPSESARIQRENRLKPIVIKPKDSIHIRSELAPVHGAYFVDSRNIGVEDYTEGTPLSVVAMARFYDCKENDLNKDEKFISVKSNALELVGDIGAFIK